MNFELNRNARLQRSDKPLLVEAQATLSYGEQGRRCNALARWCEDAGIPPGGRILVAVADDLEQASLLLGLIAVGRAPLIVDPHAIPAEILPVLAAARFEGVIAEPRLFDLWQLARISHHSSAADADALAVTGRTPSSPLDVASATPSRSSGPCAPPQRRLDALATESGEKCGLAPGLPWLKVVPRRSQGGLFDRLLGKRRAAEQEGGWPALAAEEPSTPPAEPDSEGLAYTIFTSGTTSRPKGVEIGQGALRAQMGVLLDRFGLDADSRLLNVLPLHHADGLVQGPLLAWVAGGTVHRPAPFSAKSLQSLMDAIYRERISHLIAVPTMLSLMLRLGREWGDNFRSPDFRFAVSCAGHLEQPLWEALERTFGIRVANLYGLSETVTSIGISGPEGASRRVGTLGLPVNCRVRVLDGQGTPGLEGELWVSGPQLMAGYHQDPEATAEVLVDGWLRTGDLVRRLPEGHLELIGRCKNLIVSGGRNISPEEVAACLNLHPQVVESVVLGQSDPDWGERVAALVVAEEAVEEAELVAWCRARLSEYKIPKRILQVAGLEKGPSGKVRLDAARRLLDERLNGEPAPAAGDLELTLRGLAARCFRIPPERLRSDSGPHNTPGWDSLAHMELVVAIEGRFGLRLTPREIMQIDSLGRAAEICRAKRLG